MKAGMGMLVCRTVVSLLLAGVSLSAADLMPAAQQNALVHEYCAVCHTDAARNGGLSLQYFDAAQAPPSLMAMLLSKLTGGVPLKTAAEAPADAAAASLIAEKMKSGAMGAAGIPAPPKATMDGLIHAFTVESAGAGNWTVGPSSAPVITASTLREFPRVAGEAEAYRLIASCNSATGEGQMQLAWSPVAQSGSLAVSIDGAASRQYRVEGSESMGNGNGVILHGLAALDLSSPTGLPAESLTVSQLFPGRIVTFSFADLTRDARQKLHRCFPAQPANRK
jgi:hypothetical protein